jgi:uncharacterized protein with von Willebrand factor type A (vWA) domain
MRITKPNNHDLSDGENTNRSAESMVSVDYLDEPIPVSEHTKNTEVFVHDVLNQPSAYGLVPEKRVKQLEAQLEEQQEKIDQLEKFIDILATASPADIHGECPECGVYLEEKKPIFKSDHIACPECETIVVGLE